MKTFQADPTKWDVWKPFTWTHGGHEVETSLRESGFDDDD